MHRDFVEKVLEKVKTDPTIVGLAVGGSWINNQIDEFSDIDFLLITDQLVSDSTDKMVNYARGFGKLLNAFTGEHIGEKRLLICMYDDPLIHIDIKFVTREEFKSRVENPVILWDRDGSVQGLIESTVYFWPEVDYQWLEDRFWTWVHYVTLKIGRGENFEALDGLSFLRVNVLAPLLQIKNGQLPRGMRRIEKTFNENDLNDLKNTIPCYSPDSLIDSLTRTIEIYRDLRNRLFNNTIILRTDTETKCVQYFDAIMEKILKGTNNP
ncbi:MAG: aminoglycoside 6-adenylyltransferase [Prolixibacteraceae bacterium]